MIPPSHREDNPARLLGVRMNHAPGVDGVRPGPYVETVTGEASLVGLGSLDEGS
jgi:hypothetical protein